MQDSDSEKVVYVRISEELHIKLKKRVAEDQTTITDLVREYLEKYVKIEEPEN